MKRLRVWLAFGAVLLVALPAAVQACSPAMVSLHEQFSKYSRVFLGTVKERVREAAPGQAVYTILVDEAFKGLPGKGSGAGELEVTLSEGEQCGLGKPVKNGRILVFMNEGEVVNATSRSRLIWRAEVSRQMPFKVTWLAGGATPADRVWRVEGTPGCADPQAKPCRVGSHGVDVDRWSGEVVRVFATP